MPKTLVVFRKFKDHGDVVALFPANYLGDNCESYQHIGQHGVANYAYCMRVTLPATPAEYAPLERELERIGYRLNIKRRYTRAKEKE